MPETAQRPAPDQPWVSVIIPAYNAEDYIGRAIESTLQQSISSIEVIVVDDASTDGTLAIVQDFSERDPRVKAITRQKNAGAAAARNIGIDAAEGEWIAHMDADDWFSPTRFSALLKDKQDSPADVIADNFYLVDYASLKPQTTFSKLNQGAYDRAIQITASSFVKQSNKDLGHASSPGFLKPLLRRSFLNQHGIRYRETLRVTHDFFMHLDCLLAGAHFYFHPDPHYFYLLRPDSLCRSNDDGKLERSRLFIKELKARLKDKRVSADPELKAALSHKLKDCEQKLRYRTVVSSFRRKQYLQALAQALNSPLFLVRLFQSVVSKKVGKSVS